MIVDRIWAKQPGTYFCISTKSGGGKWLDHFFSKERREVRVDGMSVESRAFKELVGFLEEHSDRQIYFCPHGFSKPRRLKSYAVLPHLLWSDLDEADPRTIKMRPTVAIESSPGRYVGLWFTDRDVTEELNMRMSYFVGADKSGWDLTQVLRVPGTTNYKYQARPRVRILWQDGPLYKVKKLDSDLPELEGAQREDGPNEASRLFKKYQSKLPHWCRRELLNGKPVQGKQSEMIWKLGNTLIESGVSTDDAFILLKASPWNKFAGRRNEDDQLQRELDKAIDRHLTASKRVAGEDDDEDNGRRLVFRNMEDVEEEDIDWLWPSRIALGEVTILEGDPGLGKSYLMQKISCHVADGIRLPSDLIGIEAITTKGKVVYCDIENSAATVTKKRLSWNKLENMRNFIQCEEPFSISDDDALAELYEEIARVKPVLVVFDTVNTYLGGADAFKGHEIAVVLSRFKEIAQRFHCAVVVLRHLTKSSKERAIYRGQGSIQFTGTARVVLTVGVDPNDSEQRVVAVSKINIGPMPKALTFAIEKKPTVKEPYRSQFAWGDFVDLTADDIVAAPPSGKNSDRKDAAEFLGEALEEESVEVGRLEKMAESRGISRRTLHRAADGMGIIKKTKGFGAEKKSLWSLPA